MISPEEFKELSKDLGQFNVDWDILLKMFMLIEMQKLNFNLSQIDFSLRGLVGK